MQIKVQFPTRSFENYIGIPYKMKIWREINLANQCLMQDWRI